MSGRSSAASAASTSAWSEPGIESSSSARSTPIDDEFSPDTGQTSLGSEMSGGCTAMRSPESNCSAEDFPVRTSPSPSQSPEAGAGSTERDQACSSSSPGLLTLFSPMEAGCCLRTFPDSFPQTVAEISPSYSRRWPTSGFTTAPGECWTADTSECPSGGDASTSLLDVIEADVPPRFYLSPRAAAGMLRRAEKRAVVLPGALATALAQLAASPEDTENATTQKPKTSSQVRRLTPSECERLQGLPTGWTFVRSTRSPMAPVTPPAGMRSPSTPPSGSGGG